MMYDDDSSDKDDGRWGRKEELDPNLMYTYYEESEFL